jgi:hypothetical protein
MPRPAVLAALVCLAAAGCRAPAPGGDGSSTGTTAPGAAIDGGAGDADDGGRAPSRAELLEIFLEAARTNLERPYPEALPESPKRYAEAAGMLLDKDPSMLLGEEWAMPAMVARVLAVSDDERAAPALVAWAGAPAARDRLPELLRSMHWRPRAEYLATCEAVLADQALAGRIVGGPFYVRGGLLGEALWLMDVRASVHVMALELCAALPGPAGRDRVRRIANDRAAGAPNPRTLAALVCGEGETRIDLEAQALASLRIMALSTLGDRALLREIAANPSETALVRHWANRMIQGGPDQTKPGWEKRLDARQRQTYKHSLLEFVAPPMSPCFTASPRLRFPGVASSEEAPPAPR